MNTAMSKITRSPSLRRAVLALGLAAAIGGTAIAPALAEGGDWGRHEARQHEDRDRGVRGHDWRGHRAYGDDDDAPRYYYRRDYYAPAPVYAAPAPWLNFVFPLDIR